MSNRAKNLLFRLLDRIIDGPQCPNCKHDADIHYGRGYCLGAKYDRLGEHESWCDCTSLRKKEKDSDGKGPDPVRGPRPGGVVG